MSSSSPPEPFAAAAERAEAAYLGLALGDALGATVEFMTPREIAQRYGVHREIRGGGWLNLRSGQVTDDTTMALALGAAILADGGTVRALSCARAFDAWMRGKPVDIGNTVRRNLVAFRRSGEPLAAPSEFDAGNGAAMRVLPVALALWAHEDAVLADAACVQARVTHNHPDSDAACRFIVLAVRQFVAGASLAAVHRRVIAPYVAANPRCAYRGKRRENPSGWIIETMAVVLQALMWTDSFESCVVEAVNRGGDADTTGAIAGMLAGACYGLPALPPRWLRALDPAVAAACRRQARALFACGLPAA